MIVNALTPTRSRRGDFHGYAVLGVQYQQPSGVQGWHCTAWNSKGPLHDYWVSKGKLYNASFHYLHPETESNNETGGHNSVDVRGVARDCPPQVAEAIQDALYDWEHEA